MKAIDLWSKNYTAWVWSTIVMQKFDQLGGLRIESCPEEVPQNSHFQILRNTLAAIVNEVLKWTFAPPRTLKNATWKLHLTWKVENFFQKNL